MAQPKPWERAPMVAAYRVHSTGGRDPMIRARLRAVLGLVRATGQLASTSFRGCWCWHGTIPSQQTAMSTAHNWGQAKAYQEVRGQWLSRKGQSK
jgi:hypothetical protein